MIDSNAYKRIADWINDAQDRGSIALSYLNDMQADLGNSELSTTNIHVAKIDDQISATIDVISARHSDYTDYALNLVETLQKYITDKYGAVNGFIRDNGLKVKTVFADMSRSVGYIIDGDLIEIDLADPSNIS